MDKINPLLPRKLSKHLKRLVFNNGEDIGKGMIRKIINDAKITREEWLELIETI